MTTARLPRARKSWTVAALDPITHRESTRCFPVTPPHLVGLVSFGRSLAAMAVSRSFYSYFVRIVGHL